MIGKGETQEFFVETNTPRMFFRVSDIGAALPHGIAKTKVGPEGTQRRVQYDSQSGSFYFVGERKHGLSRWTASGNDFWWCTINDSQRGSGLFEFLIEQNPDGAQQQEDIVSACAPTYTDGYSMLQLTPLASQRTWVNDTEGQLKEVSSAGLLYYLYYQHNNGNIYLAVCTQGLVEANGGAVPLKVHSDVAFKAIITLDPDQILQLSRRFVEEETLLTDDSQPSP